MTCKQELLNFINHYGLRETKDAFREIIDEMNKDQGKNIDNDIDNN